MSLYLINNNLYQLYNLNGGIQCLRKCPLIGPCFSKCLGDDDELDDSFQEARENTLWNQQQHTIKQPKYGQHGTSAGIAIKRGEKAMTEQEREKLLQHQRRRFGKDYQPYGNKVGWNMD